MRSEIRRPRTLLMCCGCLRAREKLKRAETYRTRRCRHSRDNQKQCTICNSRRITHKVRLNSTRLTMYREISTVISSHEIAPSKKFSDTNKLSGPGQVFQNCTFTVISLLRLTSCKFVYRPTNQFLNFSSYKNLHQLR